MAASVQLLPGGRHQPSARRGARAHSLVDNGIVVGSLLGTVNIARQLSLVDLPQPLVVHCKRDPFDIYIGRTGSGLGEWGNPFTWKQGTKAQFLVSKDECLPRYEEWVRLQAELVERIKQQLPGKKLGCWCRPAGGFRGRLLCHGQILAGIANGLDPRLVE